MENLRQCEKTIFDSGKCKLVEFLGDYHLYCVQTVDLDGIKDRDLYHAYTFMRCGYVRNERTGRENCVSYDENFDVLAYATEFYNSVCKRLGV